MARGPRKPVGRPSALSKMDPQTIEQMLTYIKGGAFPYVAARAVGIPMATFYQTLKRGRDAQDAVDAGEDLDDVEEMFRAFAERVEDAAAQARVMAEVTVRASNPVAWLRWGPGRDRPGEPGWTDSAEVNVHADVTVSVDDEKIRARLEKLIDQKRQ